MTPLWPRCPKCRRRVDIRKVGTRTVASCCAGEAEVVVSYVAKPDGDAPTLPLRKPGKAVAR